jgi:hypothetical protein
MGVHIHIVIHYGVVPLPLPGNIRPAVIRALCLICNYRRPEYVRINVSYVAVVETINLGSRTLGHSWHRQPLDRPCGLSRSDMLGLGLARLLGLKLSAYPLMFFGVRKRSSYKHRCEHG